MVSCYLFSLWSHCSLFPYILFALSNVISSLFEMPYTNIFGFPTSGTLPTYTAMCLNYIFEIICLFGLINLCKLVWCPPLSNTLEPITSSPVYPTGNFKLRQNKWWHKWAPESMMVKVCIFTDCRNLYPLHLIVWCGRDLTSCCRLDLTNQAILGL